jgi:hypothetical protein
VSLEVGLELQVGETPDFDNFVPTTGDEQRGRKIGRETDTGNPVSVAIIGDGVLAFTKSVPQLQLVIAGTGNNLTVVSAEGNTGNITSVADEAASSLTAVDIPKSEGTIPGSRKCELTIATDNNILDEVGVSKQGLAGNTSDRLSGAVVTVDVPVDDGLVSRGG